jgi:cytochrome c5
MRSLVLHPRLFVYTGCVVILTSPAGCRPDHRSTMDGWTAAALQMPPAVTEDQLPAPRSEGAQLVVRYCGQCHGLPSPRSHSAQDWVPTFRRMIARMEHSATMGPMGHMRGPMGMMGAQSPSATEQRLLLTYLQRYGLQATTLDSLPSPASPAALLFAQTCARCHALPAPSQHTTAEWPAVLQRMRQHMADFQMPTMSDAQADTLVRYLQEAAPLP